ncbi:MAG: hypothetical protein IJS65_04360 [Clostridia bacterium]|nr:hypothetical protein [Clostridia bacterium]
MFLPSIGTRPKKKKEDEYGLKDSYNGGGLIAAPSARYGARSYSSKTEYPSAEPGTGDIGMEGYYVKPKSYGKSVYKPGTPVRKGTPATVTRAPRTEPESDETNSVKKRAENLGIGRHGVDAWANETETDRNSSGSMATYKVYWDAGYKGTKYEDVDDPIDDYVPENMKKRAYTAGLSDAREKQELAKSRIKAYNENAVMVQNNAFTSDEGKEKQSETASQYVSHGGGGGKIPENVSKHGLNAIKETAHKIANDIADKATGLYDTADKGLKTLKAADAGYNKTYDALKEDLYEQLRDKTSKIVKETREIFTDKAKTDDERTAFVIDKTAELINIAKWAFSEVGNNMTQTDIEGQREFWRTGADVFLRSKGMENAAWFLEHSLKDDPEPVKMGKESSISKRITESREFDKVVKKVIADYNNGIKEKPETLNFEKDPDLFYALHSAEANLECEEQSDGSYLISGKINDVYNFTEFLTLMSKNGGVAPANLSKGTVANDFALISQTYGAVKPYGIEIEIEYRYYPPK